MRRESVLAAATLLLAACGGQTGAGDLYDAPEISNVIDGVTFEAGNWEPFLAAGDSGWSWGNHRAVVVVDSVDGDMVLATIPWRRRDANPSEKSIVVLDAASQERVANAVALRVENASGDVVFQPNTGSSTYHVYYMPWKSTGSYYPTITYPEIESTADAAWESQARAAQMDGVPRARVTHIQSVDDFHSFFPTEVIATEDETEAFMARADDGWVVMPEHRDYPVRLRHFLPFYWAEREQAGSFASQALRGEYFTFQLAVVAGTDAVNDLTVAFEGFPEDLDNRLTCFNCGGVNEKGESFRKDVAVPAGDVYSAGGTYGRSVKLPHPLEPLAFLRHFLLRDTSRLPHPCNSEYVLRPGPESAFLATSK